MEPVPEGLYTVRLDGFEPSLTAKRDSVNLNPQLKIVNHPTLNDRHIFTNLNTKAKWLWPDFCHAFGVPLNETPAGEIEFPGDFIGPEDDPTKWAYSGPLLGQQAQVYVVQVDNTKGGVRNEIKYYVCRLPNCTIRHSPNLTRS